MIDLILISHGGLAAGLREAAEMIVGEQEYLVVLGLYPGETPETFADKLRQAIRGFKYPENVLILSDIHAGTPSNMADLMALEAGVSCITGVNLPMLLDILSLREAESMSGIVEQVCQRGKGGIVSFNR